MENGKKNTKQLRKKIKTIVNALRKQDKRKIGSQINEAIQCRHCTEMWRKAKNHDRKVEVKPNQKRYLSMKAKDFDSYFKSDQNQLNMSAEHTSIWIQLL